MSADEMSESAEERARRLIRRWDSFGDELDLPLETNNLVREFRAAESAAFEEGKEEGVMEERRRGREKLNRFKSRLRARTEFSQKRDKHKTYAAGLRDGQERMRARCVDDTEQWGPRHLNEIPAVVPGPSQAAAVQNLHRMECQVRHSTISSSMQEQARRLRALEVEGA